MKVKSQGMKVTAGAATGRIGQVRQREGTHEPTTLIAFTAHSSHAACVRAGDGRRAINYPAELFLAT